jgi:hypothetical protein
MNVEIQLSRRHVFRIPLTLRFSYPEGMSTYDLGNPDLGTDEKKCGGIKSDNGILKTCLVDN